MHKQKQAKIINFRQHPVPLNKIHLVGILNVTPDSFSDGGQFFDSKKAIAHALEMEKQGASMIDIGAESSRPGSKAISEQEEIQRLQPVIQTLIKKLRIPISVDTYKPDVARYCLDLGVQCINDIYGLQNSELAKIIAEYKAGVIIMHMQGTPQTMQLNPSYKNPVKEIAQFLRKQAEFAKKMGIKDIIIDPGIGFGKTTEHNLEIIKNINQFTQLGYPILAGLSRKSFIGKITGSKVQERLPGTIASEIYCAQQGVQFLRVHDVQECKQALEVLEAIKNSSSA